MLKKIAITVILLGLFVTGSLIANEPLPTYYVEVETHGFANLLEIGYFDVNNEYYLLGTYTAVSSGIYLYSYFIPYTQNPPDKFCAEGWGSYGWHDYDECDAQLYYTNQLELFIGVYPEPPPQYPDE